MSSYIQNQLEKEKIIGEKVKKQFCGKIQKMKTKHLLMIQREKIRSRRMKR